MSDGGSSGLSGTFELVGQAAKSGAGNLVKGGGTLVNSAVKQVAGSGGVGASPNMSGSFDLNPGTGGGDLFAPDVQKPANNAKQMFGNAKPLTQTGQQAVSDDRVYTTEELQKIQSIESELRSMHKQHNDVETDMEKVRREREEKYQQRLQDDAQKAQQKQMADLQSGQNPQEDLTKFKAARGTELAKGDQG